MSEKHTCENRIVTSTGLMRIGDRGVPCGRTASLQHEGKWYCKTHHPPTREAKCQERYAADTERFMAEHKQRELVRSDHARMEALVKGNWLLNCMEVEARFAAIDDFRCAIDQWMKDQEQDAAAKLVERAEYIGEKR